MADPKENSVAGTGGPRAEEAGPDRPRAGEAGPDRSRAGSVVRAGDWVLLHRIILDPHERAPAIPPETRAVPLEMRVRGFLVNRTAAVGDVVSARTLSGRLVEGTLMAVNPPATHTFGAPQPELLAIGPELRRRRRLATPRPGSDDAPSRGPNQKNPPPAPAAGEGTS